MGSAWRTRTSMAASTTNLRRTTLSISSNARSFLKRIFRWRSTKRRSRGIRSFCRFLTNCRSLKFFNKLLKKVAQSEAMKIEKLLKRYRIEHGKHFSLKDHDPADTHGLESELKPQAKELLADGVKELSRQHP